MSIGDRKARITVAFFDEAVSFGGSVVVLAHLFNHAARERFSPRLITSLDSESMRSLFRPQDVWCRFRPKLTYASRARWMNRCPHSAAAIKRLWSYSFTVASLIVNLPAYAQLFLKFTVSRPDIVHVNNGTAGFAMARIFRIPVVWHLHGFAPQSAKCAKLANRNGWSVVSISRFISNEAIKHGLDPKLMIEVPNPIPVVAAGRGSRLEWARRFGISDNAIIVAHVGRVVRWKGQLEFLRAFTEIAERYSNVVALIVGDDLEGLDTEYPAELRHLVEERHLEARVVFTGHVTDITDLMSSTDIVVHSSIEPEPFGLVITEAMAAGAAVVASRLGAPTEIVDEGVTGLLVDPLNTAEFAGALDALIRDDIKRQEMAKRARAMLMSRYSPWVFAERMTTVYESVLERRRSSASARWR